MAALISQFHDADESPEDVAMYHEMRMSYLGMRTSETYYAELMAAVKKSGIKTVDLRILLRLLIVRKSKPRVIKFLQTKGDPTSKRLVKFLNDYTSQFTNQGKFPVVNMLSSMPTISLIEISLMLVELEAWEWFVVVSTYAFVNQLDIESSIDEILLLQARHFWNDIVKNSSRTGAGYERGFKSEYHETSKADSYKIQMPDGVYFLPVQISTKKQEATMTDFMMYKTAIDKYVAMMYKTMNTSYTEEAKKIVEKNYAMFKSEYDKLFDLVDWNMVNDYKEGSTDFETYNLVTGRSDDGWALHHAELVAADQRQAGPHDEGMGAEVHAEEVPQEEQQEGGLGFAEDVAGDAGGDGGDAPAGPGGGRKGAGKGKRPAPAKGVGRGAGRGRPAGRRAAPDQQHGHVHGQPCSATRPCSLLQHPSWTKTCSPTGMLMATHHPSANSSRKPCHHPPATAAYPHPNCGLWIEHVRRLASINTVSRPKSTVRGTHWTSRRKSVCGKKNQKKYSRLALEELKKK